MAYALFQLDPAQRKEFIKGHNFYVEQTKKRLLSQFDDLESEGDRATEKWLETQAEGFNPDTDDPSDYQEKAYFYGLEVYQNLVELGEQAKLLLVAGMYHQWEKSFRSWMVKDVRHPDLIQGKEVVIWNAKFEQICDLWKELGWDWSKESFYQYLNACRLIVNVYKHGDGDSLQKLKVSNPSYLVDHTASQARFFSPPEMNHEHLRVTSEQLEEFSNAIVSFWEAVPEKVFQDDVQKLPAWFSKALTNNNNQRLEEKKS